MFSNSKIKDSPDLHMALKSCIEIHKTRTLREFLEEISHFNNQVKSLIVFLNK